MSMPVSLLTLWFSRKPQRKYLGSEGAAESRSTFPSASDLNPRIGLLVEADLRSELGRVAGEISAIFWINDPNYPVKLLGPG